MTIMKRVATIEAKLVLDQLLSCLSKNKVAKLSGISHNTLTRIDNLTQQSVDKSILDMLDKLVKKCSTPNL